MFDLYLRSYGASLYMVPLSVGALLSQTQPSFIQQSLFLLWDDSVLTTFAASELGSSQLTTAPTYVVDICSLLHYTFSCSGEHMEESSNSSGMDLLALSD